MKAAAARRQPHARYCVVILVLAAVAIFIARSKVAPGVSTLQQVTAPTQAKLRSKGQLSGRDLAPESAAAALGNPDTKSDGDYEDAELPDEDEDGEEAGAEIDGLPAPAPLPGAAAPAPAPRSLDAAYEKRRFAQQHPELAASMFENIDELWLNVHDFRRNEEWWAANPHTRHDARTNATLAALGRCTTLKCVSRQGLELQGRTRFNFPHYFLIGWQKCATTSVYAYLRKHPQTLFGRVKETHWFTSCRNDHAACKADNLTHYLEDALRLKDAVASGLDKVTADASADYARAGTDLAPELYELFPWLKIVVMLREPISRAISYTRMHTEREHWDRGCMPQMSLYDCLMKTIGPAAERRHVYGRQLEAWLSTFPRGQVHVIQMEAMQDHPEPTLNGMKEFLGMNVSVPAWNMRNVNSRHANRGQPMTRHEYETLVDIARADARRISQVLDEYEAGDGAAFVARWEQVWQGVLDECQGEQCYVDSN